MHEIVGELIPQWKDGLLEHQVNSIVRALDAMSQLVFMPTGGGKTALFYIPILVALYMRRKPDPQFKPLPSKPVALVVVPLNELGNNHVRIQVFEGEG